MQKSLNASACADLHQNVDWIDPESLLLLSILSFIDILVIVGNCFVIAAVFCSSKLRSVTNLFIVSLAVADLLVGVAVLPFSSTWEVYKVWIFGDFWCNAWLALDVWMCTSSILNLCAISLDRYLAVSRPITYPSLMTRYRAKWLIAFVWVLSFVICFPPLVGWRDSDPMAVTDRSSNSTMEQDDNNSTNIIVQPPCPWVCELTSERGYVVYSAFGSFFIPMFIMLFFYLRIYRVSIAATKAINQGFKTTKGFGGLGNRFEEQRLTLRIHRGRGSSSNKNYQHGSPHSNGSNSTLTTTTTGGSVSPSPSHRSRHERVKISVSYPSNENISPHPSPQLLAVTPTSPTRNPQSSYAVHYSVNGREAVSTNLYKKDNHLKVHRLSSRRRASSRRSSSCDSVSERALSPSPSTCGDAGSKSKLVSRRIGRRNVKWQVKRIKMETKAAKTLGIIVGGFVCCWCPFFTVYLVRGFCHTCINPYVFSVLFWLGYCNSAINPLIYALFSKDFRFAYKRIICKYLCKRRQSATSSRRGSDGSQLQGRQFRSPSYNVQQQEQGGNSLGEDSDPGGDPSDSR